MRGARPDHVIIVDWSGGNDRGAAPKKDAIWAASVATEAPNEVEAQYFRNRLVFEDWLVETLDALQGQGRSALVGFDFPFAYPTGFAEALTGEDTPFAVWDWMAAHITDAPQSNNRFEVAAKINHSIKGEGPFWGCLGVNEHEGLTRKKVVSSQFPERRQEELRAKGTFTCWQLAGAGSVGSQVLMGLPVLSRLRARYGDAIGALGLEPLDGSIVLAEVWPGFLNALVRARIGEDDIRDQVQVDLLARAFAHLDTETWAEIWATPISAEGHILGLGREDILMKAATTRPKLKNDCFALPQGVHWTAVDDALEMLKGSLGQVVGTEDVALSQALGRFAAKDIIAQINNPPHANSAVDGYAIRHEDLPQGEVRLRLAEGRAAAGAPVSDEVPRGYALRILTGAMIPAGVDTVILQEDVTVSDTHISFTGQPKKGANLRPAGEDVKAGQVLVQQGCKILPQDMAVLASNGVSHVSVFERLKVGVLSTGDEVIAIGQSLEIGQIYDANRPMLLGLLDQWGYEAVDLGHVIDDRAILRETLVHAAQTVDAILTSGGASGGDEDHVSALLKSEGNLTTWRIAVKPGRPLALGMWEGCPVFGLPGNPVAAFVCSVIFAGPSLRLLAGSGWHMPNGFTVPAAFEKRKKEGRREYLRARLGENGVEVFPSEGSGRVTSIAWADGLVELSDEAQEITHGSPVRYIPFSQFGIS